MAQLRAFLLGFVGIGVLALGLLGLAIRFNSTAIQVKPLDNHPLDEHAVALYANVSTPAGINAPRQGTNDKTVGQAWGDYNNDGFLDLYVTDTAGPNTLFVNNRDGTFSVSPLNELVALPEAESAGANFADFDNDGWDDLYVVNWGANVLLRNEQGKNFSDVTETAGVGDTKNGKTAAWGDYDEDGYLDLYVANWACSPKCGRPMEGDKDRLFHNNGDGTFKDVTAALGGSSNTHGAGFVATFADYDNDGDADIYLVNDEFINPIGNKLWRNDGPGCDDLWCFSEVAGEAGANQKVMGMGLATDDYNADGHLDFFFTNAGPMTLLQNQRDGTFLDVAPNTGTAMSRQAIAWAAVFLDANNDGWRDLYLAQANRTDNAPPANPLFININGRFTNLNDASGADDAGHTIGIAAGDYDNDGWVDLVIGNYDEGYRLYRNQGGGLLNNRRVVFKLRGDGAIVNRNAIGTRIYLTTSDGRIQMQEVKNGSSLSAGDSTTLYFGLGQNNIEQIVVVWPNGQARRFQHLRPDQHYTLHYPTNGFSELLQGLALQGFQLTGRLQGVLWVTVIIGIIGVGLMLVWFRRNDQAVLQESELRGDP